VKVVLFCATERGRQFLHRARALLPDSDFHVTTFREDGGEPPFHDAICREARQMGAKVYGDPAEADFPSEFDLLFAVSWRYRIPASIYGRARRGAFLFHDSLLPRNRGFSPTVWSMIRGEKQTGATLLQMTDEIDGGPIVDQRPVVIEEHDTIATMLPKVTAAYLDILETNLPMLIDGSFCRRPQDSTKATYCRKRHPGDAQIAWQRSSIEIHNLIRALTRPYTGAFTHHDNNQIRIWDSAIHKTRDQRDHPGRVIEVVFDKGVRVLTGDGGVLTIGDVSLDDAAERIRAGDVLPVGATLGQ